MLLYIILIVVFLILLYIIFNLFNKIEKYEDIIIEYNNRMGTIKQKFTDAYNTMQQVDLRGSFENDDEVGTTFSMLKDIITQLDMDIKQTQNNGIITKR